MDAPLTRRVGNYIIVRRVSGHRYPRNGNVGMTETRIFRYDLWTTPTATVASRYLMGFSTLRDASTNANRKTAEDNA